ncbi:MULTISPECIES: hypothetical protein [unclassified Streptomyces]|uniref:hypothetical protein n=1 Tax=unclassified Streptomyces TaxID=2593676 RepID=UPI00131A432C|nr:MULTISPECIES: hypothetical protein [unclassified Streptomyces]MYX34385.1 hypothetical protein [Streptomyces sp. SID8377]
MSEEYGEELTERMPAAVPDEALMGDHCLVSLVVGVFEGAQVRAAVKRPQLGQQSRPRRTAVARG